MSDTTLAFVHVTMNTAAFDATREYCTREIVFLWQPPSCSSQWTPSRFTVDGISYSCCEQVFAAEKSRLFGYHQTFQPIMRVYDPRLHKQHGRNVRNVDLAVWERERENIVLVGSYVKFAQTPVIQLNRLDTDDRLVAEASPYDLVWHRIQG